MDLKPNSVCSISKHSDLAEIIRRTKVMLWDEAPIMNKFAFGIVDRTLRDIMDKSDASFGGIAVVMCGEFRQVLSVIPKGLRPDIVAASIKNSYRWSRVKVQILRQNMRAAGEEQMADLENKTFAEWLLELGENRL